MFVPLTVNSQRQALCEEGLALLSLCPLTQVDGVLRHQFEDMKEELVKGAAPLKILGVMGTELEKSDEQSVLFLISKSMKCLLVYTLRHPNYNSKPDPKKWTISTKCVKI